MKLRRKQILLSIAAILTITTGLTIGVFVANSIPLWVSISIAAVVIVAHTIIIPTIQSRVDGVTLRQWVSIEQLDLEFKSRPTRMQIIATIRELYSIDIHLDINRVEFLIEDTCDSAILHKSKQFNSWRDIEINIIDTLIKLIQDKKINLRHQ